MSFKTLKDVLKKVRTENEAFGKRLSEAEALSRWDAAVGPQIAKHSRAIKVHRGVLWVEVGHPIWRSELHYRRRQILEKLNLGLAPDGPEAIIKDLLLLEPRAHA